ncbi:RIP metalloprotease RseP [uncultured Sphingomonas sp.]|uniref:RIP metalloprotease RseP n=1 Tax=uncultured Sphingomonas sp. TaxID=158754 RepID=UPI0035CC41C9
MIQTPGLLLTLGAFALMLGPLVFFHELGHYLAGRWFGIKADVFSIGFGRELAGWTDRRGTRWKLSALPLGGYVKFAGDMNPASQPDPAWLELPPAERARTFQAKPLWQRAIVVAAGPIANFLLAFLILLGFAMAFGQDRTPTLIGSVMKGSAAAKAGLKPGDRITALGGRPVDTFEDMIFYIQGRAGEAVTVDIVRAGAATAVQATIGREHVKDRFGNEGDIGLLGVGPVAPVLQRVGIIEAPGVAARKVGDLVRMTAENLTQLISGQRSIKEMGGAIRIAKISGEQMSLGWVNFVGLVALISINLGFINLLPVPMLDGGHLFFYAIEAVRRRPVTPQIQEWAFRGGLAAILALTLVVTFNDLGAIGLWKQVSGLLGPG